MNSPDKITLYAAERPDLKIVMQLGFTEAGGLFFDGCDTGSFVKNTFGSFDYEYSFSVTPEEVEKLYALLGIPSGERQRLLAACKERFGVNEAYSAMSAFMTENNIRFDTFFWH